MATSTTKRRPAAPSFNTDQQRWQALAGRDGRANGAFFYSVRTTGIYCRPGCPARLPRRENVQFHATCAEAQRAGFRPCKRCRPTEASQDERHAALVEQACRLIEAAHGVPRLDELAAAAGLSRYHFHRLFKAHTGVTPKAYAAARRASRIRTELAAGATVTEAIYAAGISSSGRFYEASTKVLGMTPTAFKSGGQGAAIRFAVGQCWLGSILVAATDKGICAILLGDDPDELVVDLQDRFPKAELLRGDKDFTRLVADVVAHVEAPQKGCTLPLDVRGTAFQQQVWQALRKIPPGTTTSYAQIAQQVGRPKSVRAVGQAIAANPIAVAIPCHRVVRTGGALSGYRWGTKRKSKLQQREQEPE